MTKLFKDLANVLLRQFIVLLLIIVFVFIGYHYRKNLQIAYHKWGHESALKSIRKYGSPSSEEDFNRYEKYSQKIQKHKNALIEIGYLEERIFETKYLAINYPQRKKVLDEFIKGSRDCSYSISILDDHKWSCGSREDNSC